MNTQMNYTKKGLNDPDNHDGVDRRGKVEAMTFYFLGLQNYCGAIKLKDACSLEEKL